MCKVLGFDLTVIDARAAWFRRCTFETAAMLLTLVSLGKLMEAIAKGQVRSRLTLCNAMQIAYTFVPVPL